jgi:hypothetical protein
MILMALVFAGPVLVAGMFALARVSLEWVRSRSDMDSY